MINTVLAAALITASMATAPAPEPAVPTWEDIGEWRISCFCTACNDPGGRVSASGIPLEYGDVAMNGVPMGSEITIEGEVFTVKDRCGIDGTVDIFVPANDDGSCGCNHLSYENVRIKREK